MALKKDKQKVLGETFDDERVKGFLDVEQQEGFDQDYVILERAYRGMKADNFETFIKFFIEDGRNINACNPGGKTFLQVISGHRLSSDYASILKNAGAKS